MMSSVCCARFSSLVIGDVERDALGPQHAPGDQRLDHALLGEVRIAPAGEQVVLVPFAFAVAHQHECVIALVVRHRWDLDFDSSEPQHIGHGVEARRLALAPQRGLHRAAREDGRGRWRGASARCARPTPAKMTVCSPTTLPPRSVAKPMSPRLRGAGVAVADSHAERCARSIAAPFGGGAAEHQRGAGRRIDLVPVMHLDDLDVEVVIERFGDACASARPAG